MSTYSSNYLHLIWATKNREPWISSKIETPLYRYLQAVAKNHKTRVVEIGGVEDHIHILLRYFPDFHLSNFIKDLKVSSNKMIRNSYSELKEFSWQKGFGSFTITYSHTSAVQEYIRNQKQHHKSQSLRDEWVGFLVRHGIPYDERFLFD